VNFMPEVMINGPEGRLEGRYYQSEDPSAPVAIVLHPHPQHGGTMNNKVVYRLFHAFARNGFSVLRINFRGVGRSQGEYDGGVGELCDAAVALDWLQQQNPNASSYWIGGFSFGSWIGMQLLMRRPEVQGFLAISPPAGKYDFTFLSPCPAPGIVLQGDQDSIVSEDEVAKLVDRLNKQKRAIVDYNVILGADHFFRNHLDRMDEYLDEYLKERLAEPDAPSSSGRADNKRRRQKPSGS
jgi:hypothetical protein